MRCKAATEVYSRVSGYFRPVSQWNRGKKEEFNERKKFNTKNALSGHADKFVPGFNPDTGLLADCWSRQDVIDYGRLNNVVVSPVLADEVLKRMAANFDASVGYNWDAMGLALSQALTVQKDQESSTGMSM